MTVDRETTLKMARAAQIRIAPEDVDGMTRSLNDILDFCALVGELDTEGTPDFTWSMKRRADRRPDEPASWSGRDEFRAAAPAADGDFFRVPRIIAGDKGE